MMTKSAYQEGLFLQDNIPATVVELEDEFRTLLSENHGVGILGGSYDAGLPLYLVSELTVQMLGYDAPEEFERLTGSKLCALVSDRMFTEADFAALTGTSGLHLRTRTGTMWVSLVKRDVVRGGKTLWLASVCDMDALYQKERQVSRMVMEKQQRELEQQAALKEANHTLERQKAELEAAYAEARLANAAKTDFLARMSHDIRTPINVILGLTEIEERFADDPEKLRELRTKSRAATWHLLSLVNDVLDMSKLESGSVELAEEPFNMTELLLQCREMILPQAAERSIQVYFNDPIPLAHPNVIGSPAHTRQILTNILTNAVKYNRLGGSISAVTKELSCDGETVEVQFTISDTGRGMSKAFQQRIFEPFSREESAAGNPAGTGLGMAIVRKLTDKMGGRIEIYSKPGEGSTFVVTLPFRVDPNGGVSETPKAVEGTTDLRGLHLLLVEDSEMNREIAEFLLREAGAEVTCATNGREAVHTFAASAPEIFDLILMDIMMPEMDGYEATRRIRALSRPDAQQIPIVAMTANAFTDDVAKCRAAGMNAHLAKPFHVDKLIAAVAGQLRRQP